MIDSVDEMIDRMSEHSKKQRQILEQLDVVEQPYKSILDKMYIQGKSLEATAGELYYSYRHIKRQHAIALEKFEKAEQKMSPNVLECPY